MNHLLTLDDLNVAETESLFHQAKKLKLARATSAELPLVGRTVALLFEKPSLRTRVSFEVAARELGATSLYLSPQEVGLGKREAVADVAHVLSSYVHAIVLRTFSHQLAQEFADNSSVPVINGLTDAHHPCQGLTDVYTIVEEYGSAAGRVLAYVGDGNNVAHSLLQAAAKAGMHVRIATPGDYEPDDAIVSAAREEAMKTGGSLMLTNDPQEAASGAHVLYTDVWASMGQESEAARRKKIFSGYQLNSQLLALAHPEAIVMHPLPAHRGEEITDEMMDGPQSRVLVQAENRLHVQKAILCALLPSGALARLSA
ncbi:MAG TPA: ornithine carbamoyltransferase [Ktedonobacterales bacterium]|nr:ornithine carbamoyltransferase [Ktedonobacterales bacterium]